MVSTSARRIIGLWFDFRLGNLGDSSPFSIRYSDQYDGKVLLVFCFAKVVRIKERSSVLLCFVFVLRIRMKVLCLAFLH